MDAGMDASSFWYVPEMTRHDVECDGLTITRRRHRHRPVTRASPVAVTGLSPADVDAAVASALATNVCEVTKRHRDLIAAPDTSLCGLDRHIRSRLIEFRSQKML
jgi:hypothetical protein